MRVDAVAKATWGAVWFVVSIAGPACWGAPVLRPSSNATVTIVRDADPVPVLGSALPTFVGGPIGAFGLFRYDPVSSGFQPVPFQIDERVNHVLNPGTPSEVQEQMYDVLGEEDGLLDGDDELVFLFGDGGPQAPAGAPWVAGAGDERYEIVIEDPRADAPVPERRVYLFAGPSLPRSSVDHVQWDGLPTGSVTSDSWSIGFADRWVLTTYRVESTCGTGEDVIDRFKGRAGRNLELESEQEWNLSSAYMGGLVGPVRAIRYVIGAASATNTIHHDVIYRAFWERTWNLRVHPIAAIALYFDLLPRSETMLFTPGARAGVAVDGVPDPAITPAWVPWALVRGPSGGYVVQYDVPSSPFIGSKRFYYRDDVDYDDAISPYYDDEDDSAFGAQGIELRNLAGSSNDTIPLSLRIYPLCSNVGDADLGDTYQSLRDNPLQIDVVPQAKVAGPVRTLRMLEGPDGVTIVWEPVDGATSYRIYYSTYPDTPHTSWVLLGETSATAFDPGEPNFLDGYYSVVGVSSAGEGAW